MSTTPETHVTIYSHVTWKMECGVINQVSGMDLITPHSPFFGHLREPLRPPQAAPRGFWQQWLAT